MTPVNSIQSVQKIIESYQDASERDNSVVSLENRIIQSFADKTVQTENTKNITQQQIANSSPEKLIELQEVVANYNIEVSLISTIARKSVGAVETLLRS